MSDQTPIEPLCPFCQQSNACQVQSASSCWCMNVSIPSDLLAKVPDALKDKACICANCIERYRQDPEHFLAM